MSKKDARCKNPNPYLCGTQTVARGLCVNNAYKCNTRTRRNRKFVLNKSDADNDFGYNTKNIGRGVIHAD